ncbi:hypothetical protein [Variovorax sp. 278MFTsu5.1]|jgi:transcriptional regulator with XRE-family HTH domain|uniref:hypothetical protein n=1 Tax=Variovorax sp. 278MFTsu5.1 TaxID=3158366 RepID=UPI003AB099BB
MRKNREIEFGKRVSEALERKGATLHDFAKGIEKSYEMARRYSHGISIPQDPKTLELMAAYLSTSVGWLLADESNQKATPQLVEASDLREPIRERVCLVIGDNAMRTVVHGIRLLAAGDQAILAPVRPRNGDVVAVRTGNTTTLRKLVESAESDQYVTADNSAPPLKGEVLVLGVVTEARGMSERMK